VVTKILHDMHLLNLTMSTELAEDILIEILIMLLLLLLVGLISWIYWLGAHQLSKRVYRLLVQISENDSLTEGGFVVASRTFIAVPASADFEIERTIDLVFLGSKDGDETISHDVISLLITMR